METERGYYFILHSHFMVASITSIKRPTFIWWIKFRNLGIASNCFVFLFVIIWNWYAFIT